MLVYQYLIMYMALTIDNWNDYFVLFGEKIKNKIIEKSDFCNLFYSTELGTFNNIILKISFKNVTIDNYFNKYRCFNYTNNPLIQTLLVVEQEILNKYNKKKQKNYKLRQQLKSNCFKFFSTKPYGKQYKSQFDVYIKLSGVWENEQECGIIYKFMT